MRTSNSIKNVIVAFISNAITIIASFIAQMFFAKYLGKEYLGLNGLFTNIVSMLSIVELGIGTSLVYHLYKPLAEKDYEQIKSLMHFYKKSYALISIIIFILGIIMLPFLKLLVETTLPINVYIVFMLFVVESSCSYLLSYKRSILYANQENYIINIIKIVYVLCLNTAQIIFLAITKNYIIYLVMKILFRLLENLLITMYANKKHPYIKDKDVRKIDKNLRNDILKKVKGLFLHKIGGYIVLGTDNIIISKFINLVSVGIYSNYTLIINGIKSLFSQVFNSITSSVGNLLIEKKYEKSLTIYKNIQFINFWLACFCSISFFIISKSFISIWLGADFVFNDKIVFVLMIQLYLDIYGYTIGAFKNGGGLFYEDRWVSIIQSIVNIIFSIILVLKLGIIGVIIGTILSYMVLYLYSYPTIIYKKLFNKSYFDYLKDFLSNLILFLLIYFITLTCFNYLSFTNNIFITLGIAILISLFIPNIIIFIIFRKTEQFKYFSNTIIKKIIKKFINTKKRRN